MQFFAWTEHSRAARHAERQSQMPEQQAEMMHDHPIFCFETAIKLLYWCGFVYEHDEVQARQPMFLKAAPEKIPISVDGWMEMCSVVRHTP